MIRRRTNDPSDNGGVDENKLANLPVTKFKKVESKVGEEEKCPICLTELEDGEEIKTLPCKHLFHPDCIDPWLHKNSTCPICK